MSESLSSSPTRRDVLVVAALTGAATMIPSKLYAASGEVRPFKVTFPEEALADLKRRVAATRWPDRENVADDSQGVRLATIQKLAKHWLSYDCGRWKRASMRCPIFVTEIDGLDIHFIHKPSRSMRKSISAWSAASTP